MPTSAARVTLNYGKYADVVVTFKEFPTTGKGSGGFNRPHLEVAKNGETFFEDQQFFNGATYQADLVRVPVAKGDVVKVCTHWTSDETRDGSSQSPAEIATFKYPT